MWVCLREGGGSYSTSQGTSLSDRIISLRILNLFCPLIVRTKEVNPLSLICRMKLKDETGGRTDTSTGENHT